MVEPRDPTPLNYARSEEVSSPRLLRVAALVVVAMRIVDTLILTIATMIQSANRRYGGPLGPGEFLDGYGPGACCSTIFLWPATIMCLIRVFQGNGRAALTHGVLIAVGSVVIAFVQAAWTHESRTTTPPPLLGGTEWWLGVASGAIINLASFAAAVLIVRWGWHSRHIVLSG